jgi:two-component system response regulator DegU
MRITLPKITLALVDDHILVRAGFASLLKEFDDVSVIIEASNGLELLEQLRHKQPDIILLDVEMPLMNGCQTAEILKEKYPHIKVIVLTMYKDDCHLLQLMERGAKGFLQKEVESDILLFAIREVQKNGYYFDKHISTALAKKIAGVTNSGSTGHSDHLSEKELDIIRLVCEEYSNKEIAEKLFLSHRTIDTYREKIMQKIGAKNTAGVVMYAVRNDLIKKT